MGSIRTRIKALQGMGNQPIVIIDYSEQYPAEIDAVNSLPTTEAQTAAFMELRGRVYDERGITGNRAYLEAVIIEFIPCLDDNGLPTKALSIIDRRETPLTARMWTMQPGERWEDTIQRPPDSAYTASEKPDEKHDVLTAWECSDQPDRFRLTSQQNGVMGIVGWDELKALRDAPYSYNAPRLNGVYRRGVPLWEQLIETSPDIFRSDNFTFPDPVGYLIDKPILVEAWELRTKPGQFKVIRNGHVQGVMSEHEVIAMDSTWLRFHRQGDEYWLRWYRGKD